MAKQQRSSVRLEKIDPCRYRIRQTGAMRTHGMLYADENLIKGGAQDQSLQQIVNVASLPGIVGPALAMPDFHQGYGFPIGGVAAFDMDRGVVSPGGVGYDINCGVRLIRTTLCHSEVKRFVPTLVAGLFNKIPTGVGSRQNRKLRKRELDRVLLEGAAWAVSLGMGRGSDLEFCESNACIPQARPEAVSQHARERGKPQLGTLGSGNHFVELGVVAEIFDSAAADRLGLFANQLTILIHTGSRGLGHQVCDDAIRLMKKASAKYGIHTPDQQLCAAPLCEPEGEQYLGAMAAAANFAFANRQLITHEVRQVFAQVLGQSERELGLSVLYDVAHNIAKIEDHPLPDGPRRVCVHRKGATRAFGPFHPEVPGPYREIGQPVLIPGDMGRSSFVLVGTQRAGKETFGSCCHGAGRLLSRHQAHKAARGRSIPQELQDRGVIVQAARLRTLAEEMPEAYKDVDDVVRVVSQAGIANRVARLKPIGVIKG